LPKSPRKVEKFGKKKKKKKKMGAKNWKGGARGKEYPMFQSGDAKEGKKDRMHEVQKKRKKGESDNAKTH